MNLQSVQWNNNIMFNLLSVLLFTWYEYFRYICPAVLDNRNSSTLLTYIMFSIEKVGLQLQGKVSCCFLEF